MLVSESMASSRSSSGLNWEMSREATAGYRRRRIEALVTHSVPRTQSYGLFLKPEVEGRTESVPEIDLRIAPEMGRLWRELLYGYCIGIEFTQDRAGYLRQRGLSLFVC